MNFKELIEEVEKESLEMQWKVPSKHKEGEFSTIKSWQIPKTTGQLLHDLIVGNNCTSILELGTSTGYSTLWLAEGAKKVDGKVHTIEYFEPKIAIARENFAKTELGERITIHEGMIMEILENWNEKIDLCFFDADKPRYEKYFELLKPWFLRKAVVVVDNVGTHPDRMKRFLKYVEELEDWEKEYKEQDNGLLILRFKGNS